MLRSIISKAIAFSSLLIAFLGFVFTSSAQATDNETDLESFRFVGQPLQMEAVDQHKYIGNYPHCAIYPHWFDLEAIHVIGKIYASRYDLSDPANHAPFEQAFLERVRHHGIIKGLRWYCDRQCLQNALQTIDDVFKLMPEFKHEYKNITYFFPISVTKEASLPQHYVSISSTPSFATSGGVCYTSTENSQVLNFLHYYSQKGRVDFRKTLDDLTVGKKNLNPMDVFKLSPSGRRVAKHVLSFPNMIFDELIGEAQYKRFFGFAEQIRLLEKNEDQYMASLYSMEVDGTLPYEVRDIIEAAYYKDILTTNGLNQ